MLNNPTFRKGYIDGPIGQIHFRETGSGPALVLLHQSPLSGAMFAPSMPLLAARGFRTVAIDTPGYGMSDGPDAPLPLSELADAIAAAILALTDGPCFLLGHHTGAAAAASLAARRCVPLNAVVLNGVPLLSAEERAVFSGFDFGPRQLASDGSHLIGLWNQRVASSPGWSNLQAMHKHVVDMLAAGDSYGFAFTSVFEHDIAADLAAMECRTLVLTNTGEDLYAASLRAHQLRPDWAFAELAGGTHDIVDEQPEQWSRAVTDFLLERSEP